MAKQIAADMFPSIKWNNKKGPSGTLNPEDFPPVERDFRYPTNYIPGELID